MYDINTVIDRRFIELLDTCNDRRKNYLDVYEDKKFSVNEFSQLADVPMLEKFWVLWRPDFLTTGERLLLSIDFAEHVLRFFEKKFPREDARLTDFHTAIQAVLNSARNGDYENAYEIFHNSGVLPHVHEMWARAAVLARNAEYISDECAAAYAAAQAKEAEIKQEDENYSRAHAATFSAGRAVYDADFEARAARDCANEYYFAYKSVAAIAHSIDEFSLVYGNNNHSAGNTELAFSWCDGEMDLAYQVDLIVTTLKNRKGI